MPLAALPCRCCGQLEAVGGFFRAWTCRCPMLEWCLDCYHCPRHCSCPEGPLYKGGAAELSARFRRQRGQAYLAEM